MNIDLKQGQKLYKYILEKKLGKGREAKIRIWLEKRQ